MFCRKCGSSIEEGARFCGECGEPVIAVPDTTDFDPEKTMVLGSDPVGSWPEAVTEQSSGSRKIREIELRWDEQPVPVQPEVNQQGSFTQAENTWQQPVNDNNGYNNNWGQEPQTEVTVNPTYLMILKIFAGVMTAVFAIYTISNAFSGVFGTIGGIAGVIGALASRYQDSFFTIILVNSTIGSLFNIVKAVGALIMLITMISVLAGWTQENAPKYALVTLPAGLVMIGAALLKGIVALILGGILGGRLYGFSGFVVLLLFVIIAIGGMFGLTMMMGFNPMAQMASASDFIPVMKIAVFDVIKGFSATMQGIGKGKKSGGRAAGMSGNGGAYVQTEPVRHLNTDRSLAKYIILTLVTCGIYGLIMMHGISKDLNTAFEGDGEETPGIWMYILLTLLTCGIYAFLWMFWTGNRIAKSGKLMYGLHFEENGTTLIIWDLFSASTCGVGGFMMWYYLLKNTNAVCRAYNEKNRI